MSRASSCVGCGFCTPGFLTAITAALEQNPEPTEDEAREIIGGNLCRCTGYQNIVKAVLRAAELRAEELAGDQGGSPETRPESDSAGSP